MNFCSLTQSVTHDSAETMPMKTVPCPSAKRGWSARLHRNFLAAIFWGLIGLLGWSDASATEVSAATFSLAPSNGSWQATTGETNWSTGAATFPGVTGSVTANTDVATFSGLATTGVTTIRTGSSGTPTAAVTIQSIVFGGAPSSPFTIGSLVGDGTVTFPDGAAGSIGVTAGLGADQLINSNIILGTAIAGTTTFTNSSTNNLTVAGTIAGGTGGTAAAKVLAIAGSGPVTLSGNVTKGSAGTITVTDTNSGTLTLSGAASVIQQLNVNSATGIVDIGAGSLTVAGITAGGNAIQSTTGGTINASGGGTLTLTQNSATDGGNNGSASGTTLTINAKIIGANCFELSGNTGTVVLANSANSFTGNVLINGGILQTTQIGTSGSPSNLGEGGTIQVGTGTTTGTLKYAGTGESTGKILSFAGTTGGPTIDMSGTGSGTLEFTSTTAIAMGAGIKTVTLQGSTNGIGQIDSIIPNNSSTNTTALTKAGTGTWVLNAANTYSGATTISAGTLKLINSTGSGTGTSAVTVNGGGTFNINTTGTASVAGTITVNGGATFGTLVINPNCAVSGLVTINGNAATSPGIFTASNGIQLTGGLTLATSGATTFALGPVLNPGTALSPGTITINGAGLTTNAFSNLSFDLATTGTTVGSTVNDLIYTNVPPVINGPTQININVLSGSLTLGNTYTLISGYSGKMAASSFANLILNATFTGSDTTKSGVLINDFGQLLLTITNANPSGTISWTGAVDSNWQTANPATNWSVSGSDPLTIPGPASNVHFYAAGNNLNTLIASDLSINSLSFDSTATSPVSISGGTLTIGSTGMSVAGGAAAITVNSAIAMGAPQTWTNSSSSLLTAGGSVANGGNLLTLTGSGKITTGGISGTGGLTNTETGTLTFGGPNTYTGATILNGGPVAFTSTSTMGSLQLGVLTSSGTGTNNVGSTTLQSIDMNTTPSSVTATSLTALTNSVSANTLAIGSGKTFTLTGGLTLGFNGSLASSLVTSNTKLSVSGAGNFAITGGSIQIGVSQSTANANNASVGFLDVSNLTGSFSTNVTTFNIGQGNTSAGIVTLSNTANTLIATTLDIGDTNNNNGAGVTSVLTLGTNTNVIQANTINIGVCKTTTVLTGSLAFASQAPGSAGTVTIANTAGTGGANITLANCPSTTGTGGGASGTLDLRGHVSTVNAGTLTIGTNANTSTGGVAGNVLFDSGTFNATTLNLATVATATATSSTQGTLTVNGGAFTVSGATTLSTDAAATGAAAGTGIIALSGGTLTLGTVNGAVKSGASTGALTGTFNVSGGTLNVTGALFQLASLATTGSATGNLNITGTGAVNTSSDITVASTTSTGTISLNSTAASGLNMAGHNIGASGVTIGSFTFTNGTITNLGTCFGNIALANGAAHNFNQVTVPGEVKGVISGAFSLNKQGANSLLLSGANTYSGNTTVSAGTLAISNTQASPVTVNAGAVLNATATTSITTAAAPTGDKVNRGATLSLANGAATTALTLTATVTGNNALVLGGAAGSPANLTFDLSATNNTSDIIIIGANSSAIVERKQLQYQHQSAGRADRRQYVHADDGLGDWRDQQRRRRHVCLEQPRRLFRDSGRECSISGVDHYGGPACDSAGGIFWRRQ